MYLEFENFKAMQEWILSKLFRGTARPIGLDRCLFGATTTYFFVDKNPVHNLDDGQMNIHEGLLTDEEKDSLVTLEEITKDER